MLEIKEWMGKEIWEVDPFLWTSDQTASEEIATVSTGNTKFEDLRGIVTVRRSLDCR